MKDVRLFFKKTGGLKFISHLDMNRFFIRLLRKSKLNVWHTEGFNPHPYITFALPLSLGFESDCESVDFKLLDDTDYGVVFEKISEIAPKGIEVLRVAEPKYKSGKIAFAVYQLTFEAETEFEKFCEFLNAENVVVSKKTKSGAVKVNDIKGKFDYKAKDNLSLEIKLPCGNENINPQSIVNSFCEQNELQIYVSYKRISLLVDDNTIFE